MKLSESIYLDHNGCSSSVVVPEQLPGIRYAEEEERHFFVL